MGRVGVMELTEHTRNSLRALTEWWEDAGVPIDTRELDRLMRAAKAKAPRPESVSSPETPVTKPGNLSAVSAAQAAVAHVQTLEDLKSALNSFEACDLKQKARNTVIADGAASADVMVIGEGPGREEDQAGLPFVGPAGILLDKMLASIDLSRTSNVYLCNVNFWRPPGNRNPSPEELAICRPFVDKHIELVSPKLIIATGLVPANALLGNDATIGTMRGKHFNLNVPGLKAPIPVFPIFHPSFLLRRPAEKAKAWEDLLNIQRFIEESGISR